MSTVRSTKLMYELLIFGYIHIKEIECNLIQTIPVDVIWIVLTFYPRLIPFKFYNNKHYNVTNNGLKITGKGISCTGYLIFPDTFSDVGYNKGIHTWSIKNGNVIKENEDRIFQYI